SDFVLASPGELRCRHRDPRPLTDRGTPLSMETKIGDFSRRTPAARASYRGSPYAPRHRCPSNLFPPPSRHRERSPTWVLVHRSHRSSNAGTSFPVRGSSCSSVSLPPPSSVPTTSSSPPVAPAWSPHTPALPRRRPPRLPTNSSRRA